MISIDRKPLTINEFSRPGKVRKETLAIVLHWTGNVGASAKANWDFFESRKFGSLGYGSAQYIVGIRGEIIECMPSNEIAYHCGSSQVDPVSNKIYTDYARNKFGGYCQNPKTNSPNNCTIGIEMCPASADGRYTSFTLESTVVLVSHLLKEYTLDPEKDITHHNQIVGWKDCPKYYVNNPEAFAEFKKVIAQYHKNPTNSL